MSYVDGCPFSIDERKLDGFFRWISERHTIHSLRRSGKPPPWSNDPIMQKHRFCNVFRIWDRNTQYLLTEVIECGDQTPTEVVFRIFVFRFFNRIETWELLRQNLHTISLEAFDPERFTAVLKAASNAGIKLYTSAYIIPSPKIILGRAFENHVLLLKQLKDECVFDQLLRCSNIADAHTLLTRYQGIGPFIGYQLVLDVNMVDAIDWFENDFTALGPGSRKGIMHIFRESLGSRSEDAIKYLHRTQHDHWKRLRIEVIPSLDREGHPQGLSLPDVEHSLCEFAKYLRLQASGGSRMPVRTAEYKPKYERLSYKLPLKWCIPTQIQNMITEVSDPALEYSQTDSEDSDVYEVEKIVAQRVTQCGKRKKRKVIQYRIRWLGYNSDEDSWVEEERLGNCPAVLTEWKSSFAD